MTTQHQQRIAPHPSEVARAAELLRAVPTSGLDWSSTEGRRFLAYIAKLSDNGTALAWVAEQLDLDKNRLYGALNRYRRTA